MKVRLIEDSILFIFLLSRIVFSQDVEHYVIPPGGHLYFKVDSNTGEVVERGLMLGNSVNQLVGPAIQVLNRGVPLWLRDRFELMLRLQSQEVQNYIIEEIIPSLPPSLLDEFIYIISQLPPEKVSTRSTIENIRDYLINFMSIVEELTSKLRSPYFQLVEDEEEKYTTIRYTITTSNGTVFDWELPPSIYYEYVVSPLMDRENFVKVNPETGDLDNERGVLWNYYFWNDITQPINFSYRTPQILRYPNALDSQYINNINWEEIGEELRYAIESTSNYHFVPLIVDEGNNILMLEGVIGDSFCCGNVYPMPDGLLIFTVLPLEKLYSAGYRELLENLVTAGGGNGQLITEIVTGYENGSPIIVNGKVLIVRERIPFGLSEDPVELILREEGLPYDVLTPQQLLSIQLYSEAPSYHPVDYVKIIVSSDQDFDTFMPLIKERLERYIDYGGIVEIHGYSRDESNIGVEFPGGIYVRRVGTPIVGATLKIAGFPLIQSLLEKDTSILMDQDRISAEGGVIKNISEWVSQLIPWNLREIQYWHRGSAIIHEEQPVNILYHHYGNYEELQDVMTGASRIFLLPIRNVMEATEELYWNEIYLIDRWHPCQILWSDRGAIIDDWRVALDRDTGGGERSIRGVISYRLDGSVDNILGKGVIIETPQGTIIGDYSRYLTLNFSITDAYLQPVVGAVVRIAKSGVGGNSSIVTWGYTDIDGKVSFIVGDNNDYYVSVCREDLGCYPSSPFDAPQYVLAVTKDEANPGAMIDIQLSFYEAIQDNIVQIEEELNPHWGIDINLRTSKVFIKGRSGLEDNSYTVMKESQYSEYPEVYLFIDEREYIWWSYGEEERSAIKEEVGEDGIVNILFPSFSTSPYYYIVIKGSDPFKGYALDLKVEGVDTRCNVTELVAGCLSWGDCHVPQTCEQCRSGWCCGENGFCGCCEYYDGECGVGYFNYWWDCNSEGVCQCLEGNDDICCEELGYDYIVDAGIFCGCRMVGSRSYFSVSNLLLSFVSLILIFIIRKVI